MAKPIQATTYTFRKIIESGFLYVDKTRYLYDLVRYPAGTYFISRPRRFGKSLTVSILEEIFRGSKELFQGLWIYDSDYPWQSYPIIHIDFGLHSVKTVADAKRVMTATFNRIAEDYNLHIDGSDEQLLFADLTRQLAASHDGKVVLLIDEYDKPLTDNLEHLAVAKEIRDTLRSLYGVVKALDRYWRFVFITGISRFSRIGIFSTMNNLDDLTMSIRGANLLGITELELRHYFSEYIDEFAAQEQKPAEELLTEIRAWYNGFRFAHNGERVYNPFSTIQLFLDKRFSNYWFATGTPTFLIKLLQEQEYNIPSLESVEADDLLLQTYELGNLAIIPLLYQTGYLTIKESESDVFGTYYILSYPNNEVRHSFLTYLLNAYAEKYRLHGKPITLIGANFDYKARKIAEWSQAEDQNEVE